MVARIVVRDVFATNAYFAIDDATGSGFLIDPGAEAERLYGIVRDRGWRIERILLTHGHFDHTAAAEPLSRAWNAPISMHRRGAPFLADANLNLSARCGRYVTIGGPIDWFDDGDEVSLAANPGFSVRVLHTPGHTPDSVTYHLPSERCAFVGDSIIDGGVGLVKFPGGDLPTLIRSLETRILALPQDTMLLPGHSEPATLGELVNTRRACTFPSASWSEKQVL